MAETRFAAETVRHDVPARRLLLAGERGLPQELEIVFKTYIRRFPNLFIFLFGNDGFAPAFLRSLEAMQRIAGNVSLIVQPVESRSDYADGARRVDFDQLVDFNQLLTCKGFSSAKSKSIPIDREKHSIKCRYRLTVSSAYSSRQWPTNVSSAATTEPERTLGAGSSRHHAMVLADGYLAVFFSLHQPDLLPLAIEADLNIPPAVKLAEIGLWNLHVNLPYLLGRKAHGPRLGVASQGGVNYKLLQNLLQIVRRSRCKFKSGRQDLNLRPLGPEPSALPG